MTVVPKVHLCQRERTERGSLREQAVSTDAATSFQGTDFLKKVNKKRGLTG